jgi:hypothetical protein
MYEYENLLKKIEKTKADILRLKHVALELFQQGYIKNKDKVDKIIKL